MFTPPRTHNENKNFNKSIIALTIAILFSAQAESRALKEENISYDKRGDGIFVIDLDDRTTPDLNSIIVNQIELAIHIHAQGTVPYDSTTSHKPAPRSIAFPFPTSKKTTDSTLCTSASKVLGAVLMPKRSS